MSNVRVIKLLTGEELLAKTTKEDGVYKLEDPLRLLSISVPLEEGATDTEKIMNNVLPLKKNVKIFHFIPMAKTPRLEIKESHVLFDYEPIAELSKNYSTFFGNYDSPVTKLPALTKIDKDLI